MPVFSSTEQLYGVVLPFLGDLLTGPLRSKFAAAGGVIKVTYTEPDAVFLLDTTVDPPTVTTGATAASASAARVTRSVEGGLQLCLCRTGARASSSSSTSALPGPSYSPISTPTRPPAATAVAHSCRSCRPRPFATA